MIISKCLDSVIKIYIKVTTVIIGLLIDVNFKSIRIIKKYPFNIRIIYGLEELFLLII